MLNATRAIVVIIVLLAHLPAVADAAHGRQFWQSIAKNRYEVPERESPDALAHELSALLASPDPELRDDLAYSILAVWIHRDKLAVPTLLSLTDEWRANLKSGIGEEGTNSVLKRSFSALCLSSMAQREATAAFMGAERYHQLVAEATNYLQAERDLRGYDPTLHWIHSTAHTADLLAALAQSPLLTKEEAATILRAIDARLATATQVYTQGEQDRLAVAVVAVIDRKDFDDSSFPAWLAHLADQDRDVWVATAPESLARYQNHNYLLEALTVHLDLMPESSSLSRYRQQILKILADR